MPAALRTGSDERPSILIAEPDRDVRALLALTIRALGYDPVVYEDGAEIDGAVAVVM
jgi:CheY-like chemotaxis protein